MELLVVMVIIGVLAVLIFQGMKMAKEKATATVDAGDMRSIFTGMINYCSDNNDRLPTTYSGISPTYKKDGISLSTALAPYLGHGNAQDGDFMPVWAAASWQSTTGDTSAPSLLVHQDMYTGSEVWTGNPMRPNPSIKTFGYPGASGQAPKNLAYVLAASGSPANALMLSEIDKEHPEFKVSKPSWLSGIPEGMAHGTFRLGLYWDGRVGKLDKDLKPL